jgi:hypothetical protein
MLNSKTLNDLVAVYQTAKSSGDAYTIAASEAALTGFSHAEAATSSMRIQEAVAMHITGFSLKQS